MAVGRLVGWLYPVIAMVQIKVTRLSCLPILNYGYTWIVALSSITLYDWCGWPWKLIYYIISYIILMFIVQLVAII